MRAYRGGEAVDHGPTDARDWFYVESVERCAKGHEIEPGESYERSNGRNRRCPECTREYQREYMKGYRRRRSAA